MVAGRAVSRFPLSAPLPFAPFRAHRGNYCAAAGAIGSPASTGRNNTTENKVERYMLGGRFDSGFSLALLEKDVRMAQAMARGLGIRAEELASVRAILGTALDQLGVCSNHTAVYRYVTELGG